MSNPTNESAALTVEDPAETVTSATDTSAAQANAATTEGTDGDEDLKASDGKIDAEKVNEIVKRRVEKVRAKTREEALAEATAKAEEEIEFWRAKASTQRVEVPDQLPPKPKMVDYASNPTQYEVDLEKWTSQKALIEGNRQRVISEYARRADEFSKKQPEFEKAIRFFNSVDVPKALEAAILESDVGPQLSFYLSKNFKEFDRISKMSPVSQVRELAKIELKLTGQVSDPVVTKPAAPKPTTTVSGSAPAAVTGDYTKMTAEQKAAFIAERKKANQKGVIRRA